MPNRILLVDDNEESRELLGELLRGHGHDVHLAQHGKEALSILPRLPRTVHRAPRPEHARDGWRAGLEDARRRKPCGAFPVIVISADDCPIETAYPNIVGEALQALRASRS